MISLDGDNVQGGLLSKIENIEDQKTEYLGYLEQIKVHKLLFKKKVEFQYMSMFFYKRKIYGLSFLKSGSMKIGDLIEDTRLTITSSNF